MPTRQLPGVQWESKAKIGGVRPAVLPVEQSRVAVFASPGGLDQQGDIPGLAKLPSERLHIALAHVQRAFAPCSKETQGALLAAGLSHPAGALGERGFKFGGFFPRFAGREQLKILNHRRTKRSVRDAAQQDSAHSPRLALVSLARNLRSQSRDHVQTQMDGKPVRRSPNIEVAGIVSQLGAHGHVSLSDHVPPGPGTQIAAWYRYGSVPRPRR